MLSTLDFSPPAVTGGSPHPPRGIFMLLIIHPGDYHCKEMLSPLFPDTPLKEKLL